MIAFTQPPDGGGKVWPMNRPSTHEEISFE
jgi:hypothetical protein